MYQINIHTSFQISGRHTDSDRQTHYLTVTLFLISHYLKSLYLFPFRHLHAIYVNYWPFLKRKCETDKLHLSILQHPNFNIRTKLEHPPEATTLTFIEVLPLTHVNCRNGHGRRRLPDIADLYLNFRRRGHRIQHKEGQPDIVGKSL